MIEIENLHTHYGLSHIVQGVTLKAAPGEVVGIFGRNGVGKTTLLKAVAGWVRPSEGAIRFGGKPIGGLAPDPVAGSGIGFVPEDRRIFPGLTVKENLELGLLQRRGRGKAQEKAALDAMFERFPRLSERRRQLGTTLSGGEQQMLAIARTQRQRHCRYASVACRAGRLNEEFRTWLCLGCTVTQRPCQLCQRRSDPGRHPTCWRSML